MSTKIKIALLIVFALGIVAAAALFFTNTNVDVLNPKGEIAAKQRDILIFSVSLISIVVIPVFVMLGMFAWKYRENNKNASYQPDWDNNKFLEVVWWGIPFVIILILAVVTWRTSHELDPYKSLASTTKPLNVQVVALQWKWLFIYPEQKVASVNLLQIPEDTPINFTITADAPMNAFWIPSLGTQVYAMSGMSSKLSLNATESGDYKGSSSNISGEGFADMAFIARASTRADFDVWVANAKRSPKKLNQAVYDELAKPASVKEPVQYVLQKNDLYDTIVMKYMMPPSKKHEEDPASGTMPKQQDHSEMMDHDMEGM